MFYQSQPQQPFYFRAYSHQWNEIGTHLHSFFELHCCTGGQLGLTVGNRTYTLHPGEAALIFPYQPHSFPKKSGQGCFYTFDPELISSFAQQYSNCIPRQNVFPFSYDFAAISEESDKFLIKSFLYAMCHSATVLEFEQTPLGSHDLLERILRTTEAHFTECGFSMKQLSEQLGYDYGYISKYFYNKTGVKYTCFLNQRRIDFAIRLLRSTNPISLGDIASASGFGSIRSFNRNFKLIENQAPREYAASTRH